MNTAIEPKDPLSQRAAALEALGRERFDVLIVGGGITGAGALLDATARGLRAALVERDDLAVGTSSRSSKLIHGGLRYLEQFRFGLVREALAERATLLRIAGHLVHLETFAVPIHGSPLRVPYMGAGLILYGMLGAGFPSYLPPGKARTQIPSLRPERFRGLVTYRDGVEDDARLVVAVCRTAIERGAVAATRVRATGLVRRDGRVVGVEAVDELTGAALSIAADAVIDATGATGGSGGPFAADAGAVDVMPSLGIHLVVDRTRIQATGGMTIRIPGRVLFLVPWDGRWIIGTTDHPYDGPADRPVAPSDAVDEVLANVNETLDVGLTRADVLATFAGIRPLAATRDTSTVTASREHVIGQPMPGLITVRGGKYTTYRKIAADAVDVVLGARAKSTPSVTRTLALVGAPSGDAGSPTASARADQPLADPGLAAALRSRYGTETDALLALGAERGLLGRLHPDTDHLEVEVAWAVEHELALSLDDILARRLRLAMETRDHGSSVALRVAQIVGPALGWDEARCEAEVQTYTASSAVEYAVP
jgi:glycerol-3-phosphate dehydrogenase